jgi:ketosteroid isomerase-like protein
MLAPDEAEQPHPVPDSLSQAPVIAALSTAASTPRRALWQRSGPNETDAGPTDDRNNEFSFPFTFPPSIRPVDLQGFSAQHRGLTKPEVTGSNPVGRVTRSGRGAKGYRRVVVTAKNVELVRRFFEDLNRGDVEVLLTYLTPQFEMVVPAGMGVEPRTYRGPEGFRRWFDSFSEIMEIRVESHDLIAVGDRVVAPHTLHARGRETGIDTEQYTVQTWHFRDGKAEMLEVFATLDDALEAARRP